MVTCAHATHPNPASAHFSSTNSGKKRVAHKNREVGRREERASPRKQVAQDQHSNNLWAGEARCPPLPSPVPSPPFTIGADSCAQSRCIRASPVPQRYLHQFLSWKACSAHALQRREDQAAEGGRGRGMDRLQVARFRVQRFLGFVSFVFLPCSFSSSP